MNKLAAVTACLLFTVPALAQSVGEKTGTNSVLGITPTTADFVKEAAISDMFEIQSSQLAEQKSDALTKAFAAQMVTDHQKTSADLKSLVGTKAPIPTALDDSHQKMLDKLNSLSGADFTKEYDSDQVSAHKDAVSLFTRYAKGGDDTAISGWAGKTLPNLQHHLEMAQNLGKN